MGTGDIGQSNLLNCILRSFAHSSSPSIQSPLFRFKPDPFHTSMVLFSWRFAFQLPPVGVFLKIPRDLLSIHIYVQDIHGDRNAVSHFLV